MCSPCMPGSRYAQMEPWNYALPVYIQNRRYTVAYLGLYFVYPTLGLGGALLGLLLDLCGEKSILGQVHWLCCFVSCLTRRQGHHQQELQGQQTQEPGSCRTGSMVGYAILGSAQKPSWLEALLSERFFVACAIHEIARKNEKNVFCLDCCKSICPHCLPAHPSHRLLQVRRYVYHDVIRLDDLEKLIDCSYVQSYTINSAKVVFLNQRPQSRPFKGSGNICRTCERILQEPYRSCSLACKVDHILKEGNDLSRFLRKCKTLSLSDFVFPQFEGIKTDNGEMEDEGQMTPNSILDNPLSFHTSSGSSANGTVGCKTLACTATTDFVKKKRSGFNSPTFPACAGIVVSLSKRKGIPQRSPLS